MTEYEQLLMDAGVPQPLWNDKDRTIDFLSKKVIALSERAGADTVILDPDEIKRIESKVYTTISTLNNIDVFKMYSKSYMLTLSEQERVATKAALLRFTDERKIEPLEHWM